MDTLKITNVVVEPYTLELCKPLVTSKGSISTRKGLYLKLTLENPIEGIGEAAPLEGYSQETYTQVEEELSELTKSLIGQEIPYKQGEVFSWLAEFEEVSPSAKFALDTSVLSAVSSGLDRSLCEFLNPDANHELQVNALLAGTSSEIVDVAKKKYEEGYRTFKIKVVSTLLEQIDGLIQNLLNETGSDIKLRLDFNRVLSFKNAVDVIPALEKYPIEYIEEPLRAGYFADLIELSNRTDLKIALDESLINPSNMQLAIEDSVGDVLILKPTVHGGIVKLYKLYNELAGKGRQVVFTSTIESPVGVAAVSHLAAACSAVKPLPALGLSTLSLFKDLESPVLSWFSAERCSIPYASGLGI